MLKEESFPTAVDSYYHDLVASACICTATRTERDFNPFFDVAYEKLSPVYQELVKRHTNDVLYNT
ncbi:hypothetical protein SOMG_05024 [Schizosaccharomyces osmophilus]|uniref:Uncharacterized protein n=1 Tax=Schizosaccharomyces osmophilus TaxID=2545709 RepID=A0AAF0AWS4_9SCHI|nr:uncharacterized protein SOMG_05024 [Schizosaccharomyces osmophilus]WBW75061.1 hypothetical protein SOMG_05024 [Schizosaccharomyces osmophilus]